MTTTSTSTEAAAEAWECEECGTSTTADKCATCGKPPAWGETLAVWIKCTIEVQCLECGNAITRELENPDPQKVELIEELEIECPTCTAKFQAEGKAQRAGCMVQIATGAQLDAAASLEGTQELAERLAAPAPTDTSGAAS